MKLGLISPKSIFLENTDMTTDPEVRKAMDDFLSYDEGSDVSKALYLLALSPALPLIAALTPEPFDEIKIMDGNKEEVDFDEPFDLIGISMMTPQATEGYRIADAFRRRGVFVVLGGVHPTLLPLEAKEHADTVITGEAERTWPQFIEDFLRGRPRSLYAEKEVVNLQTSPIPRYDLLKPEHYNHVYIQTTRGCPYDCDYCSVSVVYGRRYRHKSVEQIVEEVTLAKSVWGDRSPIVFFADDNMFVNRPHAKNLLRALIPLRIKWVTQVDITVGDDEELLDLIYESGGIYLLIGFESITESGIASLSAWKSRRLEEYPRHIEKIQSHGIGILGTFIVGTDSDDASVFEKVVCFSVENHLDRIHISILTPFPGTRIWERMEREHRLLDKTWSNYNLWGINFMPRLMGPKELQLGQLRALKRFYSPEIQIEKVRHFKKIFKTLQRSRRIASYEAGAHIP